MHYVRPSSDNIAGMGRQSVDMTPYARDAVQTLGGLIREYRTARRWTQNQLATAAKVSARTVRSVESGSGATSVGHLFTICSVLGIPLFGQDADQLARTASQYRHVVGLLPQRVRPPRGEDDNDGDDF